MIALHTPTLLLMVVAASFVWAAALAYVAVPGKKDLLLCALAMAMIGVAHLCFAQTGKASPLIFIVCGNAAVAVSLLLLVELFHGLREMRPVPWSWWCALVVVLPLGFGFFSSPSHLPARVLVAGVLFGGLCLYLVWLTARAHPALPGRGRYIALTGVLLVLLIFVLRLYGAFSPAHPVLSFGAASALQSLTLMIVMAGMSLLVLGVMLMSEGRLAKALAVSSAKYRLLVENASEGIVVAQGGRVQFVNSMLLTLLGYSSDEVVGQNLLQFVHEDDRPKVMESYQLRLQGRAQGLKYPLRVLTHDGMRWFEISGTQFEWEGKSATLNFLTDIQDRVEMEKQIHTLAYHDSLTQLPNRVLMLDRLKQALASHRRVPRYGALMFLDLDHFKPVNDVYGHAAGDLVLIEVAQRLMRCVRTTDTVARFGGDEFVVMLADLSEDWQTSRTQASSVADKVLRNLCEPYELSLPQDEGTARAVTHVCGASIGLVLFHSEAGSEERLLQQADSAMYRAKEAGRGTIVLAEGEHDAEPCA